jgi:lysylphosphatidylglycerol synthetase-like protein (DUF2156 family)
VVNVEPRQGRWNGALALVGAFAWLTLLVACDYQGADWHTTRLTGSLSVAAAVMLAARGILLGRPVTVTHTTAAALVLLTGLAAHLLSLEFFGNALVASTGMVLMSPMPSRRDPAALPRVWALIEATHGDPLAPFAMQSMKSCYFNGKAPQRSPIARGWASRWSAVTPSGSTPHSRSW